MNRLRKTRLILTVAGLSLLAACSSQPTTGPAAANAPAARAASVSQGTAILGALRASQVDRNASQALQFVERALQQTPDRPELVWLAARLCADAPRCEPQQYETRLRKLDPGNAVVWMGPLARAQRRDDTAAAEQIVEAIGREERFDVYWNSLLWQGALALSAEAPQPAPKVLNGPLTNAINEVANWLTAVAMPPFDGLSRACDRARTAEPAVAERCRRVGRVLQAGDTYAAEAVGIGISQRSVSPNSPTIVALSEHAAVVQYQHDGAREIMGDQVEREKLSRELIELMKKLRREQDVSLAVLRWAGVPLRPGR